MPENNAKKVKDILSTLRDSCQEGLDETWDCSTEEGRKGFDSMIILCEELAKILEIDLEDASMRYSFEGTVKVCAHDVRFSFWETIKPDQDTDELKTLLTEEAETRAKACIVKDYVEGELNYETDDLQLSGWWTTLKENES